MTPEKTGTARLEIRLKPRAKNDRISEVSATGLIDVAVTSPPIDGRANGHMIELLSDHLHVPQRAISVIKGGHCRNKVVAVEGITKEQAIRRIALQ